MKNVYGYIRVSTAKQGEGVSLIVQKEAITRYASQYNLNIIRWFEEKETAAKQGRPLFMAMMKLLKARKASGVIIHKIDRSARNLKDWADLGNLIDQGVEVHFAHESLDLQARGGRLSADIQAVIAADYIRNLRQEALKGIYGRLNQGIYPFQAPIGYVNQGKGKYKTINPIQGPLVRMAFELYATKKYTLKTLADHLYHLGLRNTKKHKVHVTSLSVILNNPFYAGIIAVKGKNFSAGHEPLILPDLFKQVQAVLRGNTNQKVNKYDFTFRKLLSCNACGYSLVAETQKGQIYYRCHTKGCKTKGIKEVTIANFLSKAFTTAQLYPQETAILEELLLESESDWVTKQRDMLAAIQLQKGQLVQNIERLTDCYVEGGLDKETFEDRKRKLLLDTKTKEAAENDILLGQEKIFKRTKKFLELANSLINSLEIANLEEKRELLKITTSNLSVEGKKLIISMRSPFLELTNRSNLAKCPLERGRHRIETGVLAYSDINTSPIVGEPLSKENLRELLNLLLSVVSQLPDTNLETHHDI